MTEEPNSDPTDDARTRSFSAAEAESGGLIAGRYKLLEQIGEGGMGDVWLAQQEHPVRRRVALKLIKSGLDNKSVIARFEAERQALAMMDHQNIAKILDAGTSNDGRPFFVMEFAPGVSFTQYCDQNKLSIDQRLELFVPVCSAIQHAHQKGIIHRDLKPSNVLVCLVDGKPVPKVIDFGLAKALQHTTHLTDKTLYTEFGQVVGTLQYMSPEQAEMSQLDIDTRTDIYSLGVMLYELLTGSTPIDADTAKKEAILKVLEAIREKDPPRPSARLSSSTHEAVGSIAQHRRIDASKLKNILRGELDWIVMKALEKDRTRRYATANGFAEDIENYLRGDVVSARPPSTSYRVRKYVSKHKGFVASILSIATVLIAGIISTGWFAIDANKKTAEVTAEKKKVELERDRVNAERNRANKNERLAKAEAEKARNSERKAVESEFETQLRHDQTEATLARSNYFLAVARWDANRAKEANDFLDKVPPKYRQFEWRLARRQFGGGYMTCYGHLGPVKCVAFSPDGTRIVSGSSDNTLKLWDSTTGQELRTFNGHTDNVTSVGFSPNGARIVSGSRDNTIKLWDAVTGEELRTLKGHTKPVSSVSFSPDGKHVVSGSYDNKIKLWDATEGKELRTLRGHTSFVTSVNFSPDGARIVSGSGDNMIKLWDADTGQELRTLKGHTGSVSSVSFSPDGTRIVSGCNDGGDKTLNLWMMFDAEPSPVAMVSIKLWNAATGEELMTLVGHRSSVKSVRFSPDGSRIASGSDDNTIKLWDAVTGEELSTLNGHTAYVSDVNFSPDGARIVSGSWDNTIKVWDAVTSQGLYELKGHTDVVTSVSFSSDSAKIISGSYDKSLKLWDSTTGQELRTFIGHTDNVTSVGFSPNGARIVSGSRDNTIKLWDAVTGEELRTLKGHTKPVSSVSFSPDGKHVVSGSYDNKIKLWDADTGQILHTLKGHLSPILSLCFSPDGTRIVSGNSGWNSTIRLWDAATGLELRTFDELAFSYSSVSFSADGMRIVSGGGDGNLKIWDAETGETLKTIAGYAANVKNVSYSPDGALIVSESLGNRINLYDAATGMELRTLWGDAEGFYGLSISPDNAWIVYGSQDGTVKLWDAAVNEELRTLRGHSAKVSIASLSPDDTRVVSVSRDKTLRLWDVATGEELMVFFGHTANVESVRFNADGTRIYSHAISYVNKGNKEVSEFHLGVSEHFVWDAETGKHLKSELWQDGVEPKQISNNGRWLVTTSGDDVLLLDREFKNRPHEKALRAYKAQLDPNWHAELAEAATERQDWYAATFHRAWMMKADPEQAPAYDSLHAAYDQWCVNFKPPTGESRNGNVQEPGSPPADQSVIETSSDVSPDSELFLPPIVREMLKVPRGTKE